MVLNICEQKEVGDVDLFETLSKAVLRSQEVVFEYKKLGGARHEGRRVQPYPIEIHHIDEDPSNSVEENLVVLCRNCHGNVHSKAGLGRQWNKTKIKKFRDCWYGTMEQRRAEYFVETFVEPLFDYIDEQIDDHRTTLALLRKYKHRVEWFFRNELRKRFEADTRKGEKILAMDLYAYLHDQGLDFSIEPSSISGEADLISAQTGTERLVADVKIFDPERSKGISYICSGFNQVYQYTKDYNAPFGFLVIFKTCREDLAVCARGQDSSVPYFTHNNKTIFILVIDIFDYPESASKRGHLKSHELLEADLIRTIEAATVPDTVSGEGEKNT